MIDVSSKSVRAALKGVTLLIMSAKTASGTKSCVICPGQGIRNHTFTLRSSANITGAVQLETASDPDYTGVWAPLGGGPIDLSTIGAAGELEMQFSNVMIGVVRARITTIVAGGTLDVEYQGN